MPVLAMHGGTPVRTRPFLPPYPGTALMGEEEQTIVQEIVNDRSLFRFYGPQQPTRVAAFEDALKAYTKKQHALGVSSGTASLIVALRALGVGPGDEVIVPAATFVASALAVVACNAVPVFAECDATFGLDPELLEGVITSRTKAVMPVHLLGRPCNMRGIMEVAQRHGIAVVEDCAQGFGAEYEGRPVGSFGTVGCFSFQMNKVLTSGEGGAVVTDDPVLYERACRAHDQGIVRWSGGTVPSFCGENYRMNEFAGGIMGAQLAKLPMGRQQMKKAQGLIIEGIQGLPGITVSAASDLQGDVGSTVVLNFSGHAERNQFLEAVRAEGIPFQTIYGDTPAYLVECIRELRTWHDQGCPFSCPLYSGTVDYHQGLCPRTEELLARTATLGLTPAWTAQDVHDVVAAIQKVAQMALSA